MMMFGCDVDGASFVAMKTGSLRQIVALIFIGIQSPFSPCIRIH
jgi:hypothetical protein